MSHPATFEPKPAKILFIDIETSPNIGYTWGKWQVDVIKFISTWKMLCFGYKWDGKETKVLSLPDFGGSEKRLMVAVRDILDEADIVIAHNGDRFDLPKITTRFIVHRIKPPSPYKTIDTRKVARQVAGFVSNSLNDLAHEMGIGKKEDSGGFETWEGCLADEKRLTPAWKRMILYNKRDVDLMPLVYEQLRPYMKTHPNLSAYLANRSCPRCGKSVRQSRGYITTQTKRYQRFQCQNVACMSWSKETVGERVSSLVAA